MKNVAYPSRKILFRGKDVETGEWRYGYLVRNPNHSLIFDGTMDTSGLYATWKRYEVLPETVGQFAGLTDKNGKEAYFDDLVILPINCHIHEIVSDDFGIPCFMQVGGLHAVDFKDFFFQYGKHNFEIVGSRHDNPELLKG